MIKSLSPIESFFLGYETTLATLLRTMALIIMGFISQMYLVNAICTAELFPTCIRNLSYSFGQFTNRIGVTLSPQVFLLVSQFVHLHFLYNYCSIMTVRPCPWADPGENRGHAPEKPKISTKNDIFGRNSIEK